MTSIRLPDLVIDSEIPATIEKEWTKHMFYESGPSSGKRKIQVEQKWKRKEYLGKGSYGTVWLEECISGSHNTSLRAVKQIRKTGPDTKHIIYHRELEAIIKFSNAKYNRCFVKSYGWYQCENHVYITMEYHDLGDLSKHLFKPLPEKEGCEIVFQILEGLYFMHKNEFAHRDLKPNNIMVVSKPPNEWWVKISDFGISKREEEGMNSLSTAKGTIGYLAPELLGFMAKRSTDHKAADIWALGETTVVILTHQPTFEHPSAFFQYCSGISAFPTQTLKSHDISDIGCNFIKSLMTIQPEDRKNAEEGLKDPWFNAQQSQESQVIHVSASSTTTLETASSLFAESSVSIASKSWSDVDTARIPTNPEIETSNDGTTVLSETLTTLKLQAEGQERHSKQDKSLIQQFRTKQASSHSPELTTPFRNPNQNHLSETSSIPSVQSDSKPLTRRLVSLFRPKSSSNRSQNDPQLDGENLDENPYGSRKQNTEQSTLPSKSKITQDEIQTALFRSVSKNLILDVINNGLITMIEIHPNQTVEILRHRVGICLDVPSKSINLRHQSSLEPLQDNKQLYEYSIRTEDIITVSPAVYAPSTVVHVKSLTGEHLFFRINMQSTVGQLKKRIYDLGLPARDQYLVSNGTPLLDDENTLSEYGIISGSILQLIIGSAAPETSIFLMTLKQRNLVEIRISLENTVRQLKHRIDEKDGRTLDGQCLIYNHKHLMDDHKKLVDYGIRSMSILHVLPSALPGVEYSVTVKTLTGKRIIIPIRPESTIGQLKGRVQSLEGIPPQQQVFIFGGQQLMEDDKSLLQCGIPDKSTIHLMLRLREGQGYCSFVVKTLTGVNIDIKMDFHDTIGQLKNYIYDAEGIPPDQQRLIYEGKQLLNDDESIQLCGIHQGATIHLVLRLRGS